MIYDVDLKIKEPVYDAGQEEFEFWLVNCKKYNADYVVVRSDTRRRIVVNELNVVMRGLVSEMNPKDLIKAMDNFYGRSD